VIFHLSVNLKRIFVEIETHYLNLDINTCLIIQTIYENNLIQTNYKTMLIVMEIQL
jgi:hypothetical protein